MDDGESMSEHPKPKDGILLGEWSPKTRLEYAQLKHIDVGRAVDSHLTLRHILTEEECRSLIYEFETVAKLPVGVNGYSTAEGDIGSYRATAWAEELSKDIFLRMAPQLPTIRVFDDYSYTDWFETPTRKGHKTWMLHSLSPVLRFMKYTKGGRHDVHYDCGYDYGDGRRTLMSFVIYLNTVSMFHGGATRFINDGQEHMHASQRDYSDWTRPSDLQIARSEYPTLGSILVFDHKIPHDVEQFRGDVRYIIRGDVVYRMI